MSPQTPAVLVVAGLVFLIGVFYVGKPITEYTSPGEWKVVKSTNLTVAVDTLLLPNQTVEARHYYTYHVYPNLCLAWFAQNGYYSITPEVFAETMTKAKGHRQYNAGPKRQVTEAAANANCFPNQAVTIQLRNTDRQPNVVRVVFATPHKGANPAGFQNNLCNDPSRVVNDCKNLPLTPASEFPTDAEMAALNADRRITGNLVAASSLLVVAAGHPIISLSIIFALLKRLVPSPRAWAARRELRRSAQTEKTYDANKNSSYRKRSSTPFHQHQDIDDLDELAEQAKAETERVKKEIQQERVRRAAEEAGERADDELLDELIRETKKARGRADNKLLNELAEEMKEVTARIRKRDQGKE